jgi:thiamine transport system ATP-binding protein
VTPNRPDDDPAGPPAGESGGASDEDGGRDGDGASEGDGGDAGAGGPVEGATPGVELEGVTVRFGGVRALADVSLSVADGEFFTLVGPSGCGKTTTLRTVAGFETPDAGVVRIGGRDVAGVPPEARGVGVVFQSYALFPTMTVRENVGYGLRFTDPPGGASAGDRVDRLLELVDMAGLGDRDPAALSGGQRQRVALARALAPGPEVLLLDEPLSALDARLRERLRVTVREIQRELSITTVYVTHDQAEALAISDRVAVVRDGRIEQVGAPETVYREPATRFVASFVGDTNLLDAEVTAGTDPGGHSGSSYGTGPRARLVAVDGAPLAPDPDPDPGPGPDSDPDPNSGPGGGHEVGPTVPLPSGHDDLRPGDPVTLCVRPESFTLADRDADGASPPSGRDVHLDATVRGVEFLGDAYRVRCVWAGRELRVRTTATEPPSGTVRLGVDVADATLLRGEHARPE